MRDSSHLLRHLTVTHEFLKAKKLRGTSPLDILIILQLLSVTDDEGSTGVSIEWLSQRNGASRSSIERSLKRLSAKSKGWIVRTTRSKSYSTNTYSVQINNLPIHKETKSSVISTDAMDCAHYYHGMVKVQPKIETRNGRLRSIRVSKDWQTRWSYAAQTWLDEGYDSEHIKDAIEEAFRTSASRYCHGLHTLKRDFKALLKKNGWKVTDENGYLLSIK